MECITTERRIPYYCTTNSGHEHSMAWEAENCSQLFETLQEAFRCAQEGVMDYDALYDAVREPCLR